MNNSNARRDNGAASVRWLYRDTERLCTVIVARTLCERGRGLLGRDRFDGALLLQPATSVHTFGMRFDLDVAHLDRDLRVVRVGTMPRNRLGRPVLRARSVLEAEAGTFDRWGLRVGHRLQVVHGDARRVGGPELG